MQVMSLTVLAIRNSYVILAPEKSGDLDIQDNKRRGKPETTGKAWD